jgi:DNA replication and repair protein RecF
VRRKFLDWGMFHVEHSFYPLHSAYKKALVQKNALLKNKNIDIPSCKAFDNALVTIGIKLHFMREKYFQILLPKFNEIIKKLCPDLHIKIKYIHGWGQSIDSLDKTSLLSVLESTRDRDIQLGYCSKGAHRADLRFNSESHLAKETLSRGQQKVILIALMLAQGQLLAEDCLYLIDDLCAELDVSTVKAICHHIKESYSQAIFTSLDTTSSIIEPFSDTIFHIEQGSLN